MFEVLGFNLVAAPMKMVGAQSACARAPRREPRGVAPHANATFIPLRRADSLGESTLCED